MFIFDLFKINLKKIFFNKKRTINVIVAFGSIFVLIFTINFFIDGLIGSYIEKVEAGTNGGVVISAKQKDTLNQDNSNDLKKYKNYWIFPAPSDRTKNC